MKTTLSFKIDPKIKNAILKLAEKENRSLSNYVVTVLIRHLEEQNISWRGNPNKRKDS
jgi:predicted transcriptional regulator